MCLKSGSAFAIPLDSALKRRVTTMSILSIILVMVAVGAIVVVFTPVARLYRKFTGTRVVTCPDNKEAAAVEVDAVQAAFSSLDQTHLRLKECSRWPEMENCGQECLQQIQKAPEDCLLKNMLIKWYAEKSCAICRKPVGTIQWHEHKPALLGPDHVTLEWFEFRPEKVQEVLATHLPVCWDCHITSTFRRQHPELVVDRPWKATKN
jgi:hypothetical protein